MVASGLDVHGREVCAVDASVAFSARAVCTWKPGHYFRAPLVPGRHLRVSEFPETYRKNGSIGRRLLFDVFVFRARMVRQRIQNFAPVYGALKLLTQVVSHMVEKCAQSMLQLLVLPTLFAHANQGIVSKYPACLAGTFWRLGHLRSTRKFGSTKRWLLVFAIVLSAMLGHTFKEQDSVDFPVFGVFLHCLATRGTSRTVLSSSFVLCLPSLLGHTLNEQFSVKLPCF